MQSHLISRRSLIRSSLIGLACSAAPAISAAEKDDWTETYDVVIIGSGFAGLAAAYSAPGRTHQKLSNEPRYRSPFIGDLTRGTF